MPDALREAIDALAADRRSIIVVNGRDDDRLHEVVEYFDAAVADRASVPGLPDDTLVVTDGDRTVGAVDIEDLHDYVFGDIEERGSSDQPPSDLVARVQGFLTSLDGQVHTLEASDKTAMIRVSRHIEQRAFTRGTGRLHAGFQRLSRLEDGRHTLDTYRRLADRGVETHVYGVDDWHPPTDAGLTVHGDPDGSVVGDYWFVVDDGGGDPAAGGAVLAREVDPGRFRGIWAFQAEHVADVLERIETDVQPRLDGD